MSSNNPNLNGSHNYTQLPRLFSLVCLSSVCFTDVLNMSKSRSEQWLNHAESTRIVSPCGSKVLAPRYLCAARNWNVLMRCFFCILYKGGASLQMCQLCTIQYPKVGNPTTAAKTLFWMVHPHEHNKILNF